VLRARRTASGRIGKWRSRGPVANCAFEFSANLCGAGINVLAAVVAALGAAAVASAILMILELSDPYSGLFRMRDDVFEAITGAVGNR
jgi:hypothetical protein